MADAPVKTSPAPAASNRDDDVVERRTLRDYYIILRERLWIALPLALLVSIGYGYKQLQVTPTYAARATMQFEKPDTVVNINAVSDQNIHSDVDLNTKVQILQSNMLAAEVRKSFTPEEQAILKRAGLKTAPPGTDPSAVPIDMGYMSPAPSRASFIIAINVTHPDPDAAALVANRYVETFMNFLMSKTGFSNELAIDFLVKQGDRLRKESEDAALALQKYMKEKNLISLESSTNLVTAAVLRAASARDEARFRVTAIDEKLKQIQAYRAENRNLLEIAEIGSHGTVAPLKGRLNNLEADMKLLAERYFERHPKMVDKVNEITVTETDLKRAVDQAIAELKARQAEAHLAFKISEEEYAKAEKAQLQLGEMSVEFQTLKTDSETKRSNYVDLVKRLNDTKVIKNIENIPVRPLDKATPNYAPIAPNRSAITRTSIGIGSLSVSSI